MNSGPGPTRPASYDRSVALVLQGGGALGSYQAGVFAALAASPYQPDWVAGISIGAINAALIAGNAPERRVGQLRAFWEEVTTGAPGVFGPWPGSVSGGSGDPFAPWRRQVSAQQVLMFGVPGFFVPQPWSAWFAPDKPVSYYDTAGLKSTLERLVDFDRINHPDGVRLSVGAVNVRTGRFGYFDSADRTIRAEHVMASGALPPGFPAIEIDGESYWDGGLVSNTPLSHVLESVPRRSRLTFQVDVFQAYGLVPTTLDQAMERDKDIRYASRTRINTEVNSAAHETRHAINALIAMLPPEVAEAPQARRLQRLGCVTRMDIVQLIYRPFAPQGAAKDYEFSRTTMEARWDQGRADAEQTLWAAPWLQAAPPESGARVFDVVHDLLVAGKTPAP